MEILHKSKKEIAVAVPQVLSLVGISNMAKKYPSELSAGEQQRVAIARAIVNGPSILIADEPTGNLDPNTAWEIMRLLEQINMNGTTIVMVTHAKDIVDKMNKRVVAIDSGKIIRDYVGNYLSDADMIEGLPHEEREKVLLEMALAKATTEEEREEVKRLIEERRKGGKDA